MCFFFLFFFKACHVRWISHLSFIIYIIKQILLLKNYKINTSYIGLFCKQKNEGLFGNVVLVKLYVFFKKYV